MDSSKTEVLGSEMRERRLALIKAIEAYRADGSPNAGPHIQRIDEAVIALEKASACRALYSVRTFLREVLQRIDDTIGSD